MKRSVLLLALFITLFAGFLRFYKVDTVPPGLYIDEASIGYNAYSLLRTGKDEFGVPHPLWFRSFGDYKMPVYIYMTEGSIAVFGKNEFAVRFPSALFGTLTVLFVYLLLKSIFPKENKKLRIKNFDIGIAEIAAFFMAISPWHLQFSRGGFEVTVGLFFLVLGCYLARLYWEKQRLQYLFLSVFFFAVSIYSYHAYRVLTPLVLVPVILFSTFLKRPKSRRYIVFSLMIFFLLCIPFIQFTFSPSGLARFTEVSAFSGYKTKNILETLVNYSGVYIKNYLSFFSFRFLFVSGDGIGSHQIPNFGVLPLWQFPFLAIGFFSLLKSKAKIKYMLFIFLAFIPLGASLAVPSPHSLRTLPLVVPYTIIIAWGVFTTLTYFKQRRQLVIGIAILLVGLFEFLFYLDAYYVQYPKTNILDWGAGYKDVVAKAEVYHKTYDHIVIDKNLGLTYIYFKFYDDKLPVQIVDNPWRKPEDWKEGTTLYIRPYYQSQNVSKIIDTVRLENQNKDIFAEFFKL